MIRKSIHTIEEVLSESVVPTGRKKDKRNIKMMSGDEIRMDSHRYWVFKLKGTRCVCCGIEGKYFAKEKHLDSDRYHFNLYAIDSNGKEIMMTKDHIFPKSYGGKDDISNYQPMCKDCNLEKGNKLPHQIAEAYKFSREIGVLSYATKSNLPVEGHIEDSNKGISFGLLA